MSIPNIVQVPYVNLAIQHQALRTELLEAVAAVLDSGQFILGDAVEKFEQRFAEMCGTSYAIGVNSGTDSLILALRVLGIGAGDEVILPPNSFIATASAVAMVGAHPVFVDVGGDYNINPDLIERAITPKTKAILPVHLTGRAAEMEAILGIAARHGLAVVEDAAQAVLAEYRSRRVGSLGTIGCFSLHPLKTLNACGDGGMITTNDAAVAGQLRILRNIGMRTRDDSVIWSGNSRLDTIQAAMLLVKLRYLNAWTEGRRANADFYRHAFCDVKQIIVPQDKPHERAVYHTFVIQAERRDELKSFLAERGIQTSVHYPVPIHRQRPAAGLNLPPGSFPVAEGQALRILSLPVYPELTQDQLHVVVGAIRAFFAS